MKDGKGKKISLDSSVTAASQKGKTYVLYKTKDISYVFQSLGYIVAHGETPDFIMKKFAATQHFFFPHREKRFPIREIRRPPPRAGAG